jgi:hypothetical protein
MVYDRMSTNQKFKTTLPKGKIWDYAGAGWGFSASIDLSGDGKGDIIIYGYDTTNYYTSGYKSNCLFLDGTTGSTIYSFLSTTTSYTLEVIADVDGDGKNEIVMEQTSNGVSQWVVYATSGIATNVTQNVRPMPTNFLLSQNYPNPFNPTTTIEYQTAERSDVHLDIYDSVGRLVRSFNFANQPAGTHSLAWDGRNVTGQPCASGAYFYRVVTNG